MIMGAAREKDQADFDLERFMELFDEALTSNDPRIKTALGHLMTITAMCIDHSTPNMRVGPLRRMYEDNRDILRRIERLESDRNRAENRADRPEREAPYQMSSAELAKDRVQRVIQKDLAEQMNMIGGTPPAMSSAGLLKDVSYKGSSVSTHWKK